MPKIPTYTAQGTAAVPNIPAIPTFQGNTGAAMLAQGLGSLGQGAQSMSYTLARIEESLQAQKADIESTTAKSLYTSRVRLLKDELLTNPDLENPTQEFMTREQELNQELIPSLTTPGSQQAFAKFRAGALPDGVADMVLAEKKLAVLKAGANVKNTVNMLGNNAATAGTPGERQAIDTEVGDLLTNSVNRRIISADVGESLLKAHNERVDSAWATRNARTDPLGTADDLMMGKYKGIPQDRAERLANVLVERAKSEQKELERKAEQWQVGMNKWFTEQKHMKETELTIAAGAGTLTIDQLNQEALDWQIHPERYQAIKNVLDKPDKKELSDPETLINVSIDGNSGNPKIGQSQLAKLRESGLLNQADYERESNKRSAEQRHQEVLRRQEDMERRRLEADGRRDARQAAADAHRNASDARIARNQEYTRASELLRTSLGIPSQWDKLDQTTKRIYASAMQELQNRAESVVGMEKSSEVVRDIIQRYAPQLDHQGMLDAKQIESTIRFKSFEELEANKDHISLPEYQNNERALIQMNKLRKQAEERAAAKAAQEPKAGGIFNWFKSTPAPNQPGAPNRRPQ
jgi:hypothetical protein